MQMKIGVPKEIKTHEYRAGLVPASVRELTARGHSVMIETNTGAGIGFDDSDYEAAGAVIAADAKTVFSENDMIIKVKEPQPVECAMLREDQILYTFLHLAPDPVQTKGLIDSGCIAIAYETVTDNRGGLPLLAPMSEVAGKLSVQVGAHCLEKHSKGRGVLLGGVPGVPPAHVVIIGGGMAGTSAARVAVGMGAQVTILERSIPRLRELDAEFGTSIHAVYSTFESIEAYVTNADLVIGSVLVPGAASPKLVTRDMIRNMKSGSAIVDIAVDQGGCVETTKATTHADPTFIVDDVVHYCVANMPGAVPRTSAIALNNATLPFAIAIADKGVKRAMEEDIHLMNGLNVCRGNITFKAVSEALGYPYVPAQECVAAL